MLTNSRITRIGELLKEGKEDEQLLRDLEGYRSEFVPAYNLVVSVLTDQLGLTVTGRSKSTISIVEKLRRGSIRLSQIQDIVGCRVVADGLWHQDQIVEDIARLFVDAKVIDKRAAPMHGYRAVHVLVVHEGRTVEIQVRTRSQHFWANGSEKLADKYGQGIKYGVGEEHVLSALNELSNELARLDRLSQTQREIALQLKSYGTSKVPEGIWKHLKKRRRDSKAAFDRSLQRMSALMKYFWSSEG